mgnify:CR=1 FL=1
MELAQIRMFKTVAELGSIDPEHVITPGLFVQRIWSRLPAKADGDVRRIQGAFTLLGQLLQEQERVLTAGRWPAQQRLLLCDDDFGTSGWSWVPHGAAGVPPVQNDPLAYPRIIAGLSALTKA